MDFVNRTPFPAGFFNTVVGHDQLLGAVVLKAVYRIQDGKLAVDADRAWPVQSDPVKTDFGEFDGESPFAREAVDFILLGKAYAPAGRAPVPVTVPVTVKVQLGGSFSYSMLVFGDRYWLKQGRDLAASEPAAFESIPLTWERAYGGKCKVETGELPYHSNPKGRGYYLTAEQAEGRPLPNIENPACPIRTWKDQPEPAGTAPYSREWSMRALNSVDMDLKSPIPRIRRVKPAFFNNSNPRLIRPEPLQPGEKIAVAGVRPRGAELGFVLPHAAFHVHVQLQDRRYVFPSHLDTVIVLADEERVVLGFRSCFRYRMVPLERRAAVLYAGDAPVSPPPQYAIRWAEFDSRGGAHG